MFYNREALFLVDTECDLDELTAILEQDDGVDDGDLTDENATCESEVVQDPDKETKDKDELGKDSESESGNHPFWYSCRALPAIPAGPNFGPFPNGK